MSENFLLNQFYDLEAINEIYSQSILFIIYMGDRGNQLPFTLMIFIIITTLHSHV